MKDRELVAIMAAILKTDIRDNKERDPVSEACALLDEVSSAIKGGALKLARQLKPTGV